MKSVSLLEPGKFGFIEIAEPEVKADETLVEVLACGVCGSDLHAMSGKQPFFTYPRRLGHELCVRVIATHEGSGLAVGDQCIVEPYFYCGECAACRKGKTNCCSKLSVLGIHFDGGHTSRLAIQSKYLHKANQLSVEQAALVEPLAIGAHAGERAEIKPAENIVVLGMGTIGLAVALFAKSKNANLVVVDIDPDRLKFAEHTLGLGKAMQAGPNLAEQLVEHFGHLPSCIIDATGNEHSMSNCFDLIATHGRIVFVGLFRGNVSIDAENFHQKSITLLASRAALSSDFSNVIAAISRGDYDPSPMVTERFNFAELETRLPKLPEQRGLIKAIIDYP